MKIFDKLKKKKEINKSNEKISEPINWPDHVVTLDKNNFTDFIYKYPLVLVDFWAPWCAPCKAMSPRIRKVSTIYKGKVAFGKVNTEENQDISKKYKVRGIPHLVFFSYGKKIYNITGLGPVSDIKDIIEDLLKNKVRKR